MRLKLIVSAATTVVLGSSLVGLYVFRQELIDWYKLRDYQPSAEIARLSTNSSMNDLGRRLFYLHDPELLNKEEFAGKCNQTEETIVLGCYVEATKIYVFDVNDERLDGVEEVTAAHEMLHAAYRRLSDEERTRIDRLTTEFFAFSTDERLRKTIENYRKRDPSVVANELHSILGTEIRELPRELEDYYERYFLKRTDVVALAEQYAQEFTIREEKIAAFDEQLKGLDASIGGIEAELLQLEVALNTEKQQLDNLRGSASAFNAQVPVYNQKVNAFNARLQELRSLIEQYNTIVAERNAIATEERALLEAIDTRPTAE